MNDYFLAAEGGICIGFASLLFLYFNGKILGISGIIGGLTQPKSRKDSWRVAFLAGLLTGGASLHFLYPRAFESVSLPVWQVILAGLFVGFGTRLGSGCTSGHGVCGVSRLSPRSLMATLTFIFFGMLTVFVVRHIFGGLA